MAEQDTYWIDVALDRAHDAGFSLRWGVSTTARKSLYAAPKAQTTHWMRLRGSDGKWVSDAHTGQSRDQAAYALCHHNWPDPDDRAEAA